MRTPVIRSLIALPAAGLLLWALFTWPLPLHVARGIPYTDRFDEGGPPVRTLVPGDHLQLFYHFWLAADMIAGRTPPFVNLYEFNAGAADPQPRFDPYYFPFSWVYAAIAPWAGDAAGWNGAGLVSVLVGLIGLFLLARRHAGGDDGRPPGHGATRFAALATLAAAVFPYRWITLLTGSPTGFAMALVPLLLLGIDVAVRDRRAWGGWLAGLAFFCAYCADLHVFYFSALAVPAWALFAWFCVPEPLTPGATRLRRTAVALAPAVALAAVTVVVSFEASRHLATTGMAAGRTFEEVTQYSPLPSGLFGSRNLGMSNHVFFGAGLAMLLLLGLARLPWRGAGRDRLPVWPALLLAAGIVLVVALALGAHGPLDGLAVKAARRVVPKYTMIRQTVKVYCLLPSLVAVLLARLLPWIAAAGRGWRAAAAILLLLSLLDAWRHVSAGICLLPRRMEAYEAISRHAAAARPRVLVLPLWPGDSHWSSLYEYGITRSRLRLINGYAPAVPEGYATQVLGRFGRLNQGGIDDAALDALTALGCRYILFHEDAFPEQVSPFPAGITLRSLLRHPRLEPIAADGPMRSFFIRGRETSRGEAARPRWGPPLHAAARQWHFGGSDSRGQRLTAGQPMPLLLRSPAAPVAGLRYLLLADAPLAREDGFRSSAEDGGPWQAVPLTAPTGHVLTATADLAIEHAVLTAGLPPAGTSMVFRAADCFHGGATDARDGSVLLEPLRDGYGGVVYGPCLPVPAGLYRVELQVETPASAGAPLGQLEVSLVGGRRLVLAPVAAGRPAAATVDLTDERPLPLRIAFNYNRRHPVRVRSFALTRAPPPP